LPEPEIQCRSLTKRFGDFVAVDHLEFSISKGEIFGFLGPNGCGKSTTIRMICGLLTPTEGQAFVGGIDVTAKPEEIKQRIGYMSQKFSLYDDLTVLENLQFFGGVYGLKGRAKKIRIEQVVALADLGAERDALVSDLSTGIRQRLALAASILHSPEILILDEPTSGVDPVSRRRFWDLINDLASQDATILVTTHAMDEAEHCNRVAMMRSGKLVCVGSPGELKQSHRPALTLSIPCSPLFPALSIAQGLPGIEDASVLGSRLHVRSNDPDFERETLRDALQKAGIQVGEFETGETTLEDVFVSVAAGVSE